jgi:hypothetical protein
MTAPSEDIIDMSPRALQLRLDELRALYKLMQYLRRAKPIGPVSAEPRGVPGR